MHHLKFKSLAFYGIAIGLVLILFKVITVYGESNLKAPAAVEGHYRLLFSKPICEKTDALILGIQQSGIYLHGFLLPANASTKVSTTAETHPTLEGRFSNQQMSLSGKVPRTIICNIISSRNKASTSEQDNSFNSVTMQIKRVETQFIGQMHTDGTGTIEFTAIPQKAEGQTEKLNNH